jgi:UDP-N-acetylglucosamine/UDP-N-acetylgalactosamine diphosphorylase
MTAVYLKELGQPHLAFGLDELNETAQLRFYETLKKYGLKTLLEQRALIDKEHSLDSFAPLEQVERVGDAAREAKGWELIAQGKVGCLVLAGGQGTRLAHTGPKGTIAVGPLTAKSLFERLAERVLWAGRKAQRDLPLAVMTSPLNEAETKDHFKEHAHYGLQNLSFFTQSTLPFLDSQGNWFLESPGLLAEGPDGNGNALVRFYSSGLWAEWRAQGVELLNVIFVDNPLADPFDAEFIAFAAHQNLDIAMKVIERGTLDEKMGITALQRGALRVVEYSEFAPAASSGYLYATPGQFCYSMDFIRSLADKGIWPKWHLAHKWADNLGKSIPVYKYETFQFDLLEFTSKSAALLYPKEHCYAPLKNREGDKSIETVRTALLRWDKEVYSALSGLPAPDFSFELEAAFYYPTEELKARMKGRVLPQSGYISQDLI